MHINKAVQSLYPNLPRDRNNGSIKNTDKEKERGILKSIIEQKISSYDQYNKVNQSVFLRNIQVYFSRIPWPTDSVVSDSMKIVYTETMVQFSKDLLLMAQSFALKRESNRIEYMDAYSSVQVYLPHVINNLEDVVFYPNLKREDQISVEAYDFDAFRDSGWHWHYLKTVFKDKTLKLGLSPDPFALEMLAEGIAQFAVLFFRVAGNNAIQNQQSDLQYPNLINAIHEIQGKINTNSKNASTPKIRQNIISTNNNAPITSQPFTDITADFHLDFEHRSADWLSRLIRGYVIKEDENLARLSIPPAFGGSGVATEDIDNDGWVDILLLSGLGNKLLKNKKGKSFKDITKSAGLDWRLDDGTYAEPRQPIIVDFDNDGLQDIFISYVNENHRIYKNNGNGTFTDMTETAKLGGKGLIGGPATALDFNKDGLLDLYVGYFGNYLNGELPTLKRRNTNAIPNKLFMNLGNFTFEDVSSNSGADNNGWTQAVGHSDINGDGWQDIIVGNDFGTNAYYINQKDGSFIDKSIELETDKPSYTMGIGISDLNRDQHPDFYISNIVVMAKDDKYVLPNENTKQHFDLESLAKMRVVEANDLFLSVPDNQLHIKYQSSDKIGRGFSSTGWSWDADFFDFDLDGDDDLYCLTGMNPYSVYGKNNEYYRSPDNEFLEVVYAQSKGDKNILFENKNGFLEKKVDTGGLDFEGTSRSAAYFDFDNDGDLDIITNEYHGTAKLFKNNASSNSKNWLKIKLKSEEINSNKDAIGATILLETPDGQVQWQELHSTLGYLSTHPKIFHFGLDDQTSCSLKIHWTNGEIQSFEVDKTNTVLEIIQTLNK
jgi:hypothetical protein